MNLTRERWPLGWTPCADPINGDPNGLLRMDNLQEEEDGVISLTRGLKQIATFGSFVTGMFSQFIGGQEYIWLDTGDGTAIYRGTGSSFTSIAGGSNRATYGSCLGEVLILAGQTRKKDNTTSLKDLGLKTPGIPKVSGVSQAQNRLSAAFAADEGTISSQDGVSCTCQPDKVTLRAVINFANGGDTLDVGAGAAQNPDNDIIKFHFTADDSSVITEIRLDVVLDDQNYYTVKFTQDDISAGPFQGSTLQSTRGKFTRSGTDTALDWSTVSKFKFTIQTTGYINFGIGSIYIIGGALGQLNGVYTWIQVNVTDNGFYVAKSPVGKPSDPVTVVNGKVTLTAAAAEEQVTQCWFFRQTVVGTMVGDQGSFLDQYYRVAVCDPGGSVDDTISDVDAIQINIVLNPFLLSLQPLTDGNGVIDDIFGVEGLYNGRMLYLTIKDILISDAQDPDAVDSRYTIHISGDPTEKNQWIKKITNNVLLVGTNKNNYELTGTLLPLPDGTVDVQIIALGENYPALNNFVCSSDGIVSYMAADGIRSTAGSNTQLISPQLRLWFQGEKRAGIPPVAISAGVRYGIAIGKTRMYVTVPLQDGTRRLLIYDLVKKTWRIQFTDPISVFVTQSDRVLLGYAEGGQLVELDLGSGVTDSSGNEIEGVPMTLITPFDSNGQPRNRKDTFTLKLRAETGGRDVDAYLARTGMDDVPADFDSINWHYIGTINSNGEKVNYFPLNADDITLGFKYALRLVDKSLLTVFRLYEYTIEYDPRPEQLDYLRIQPSNLGTISRKRIVNYAFVIDTLGNNITFTPLIDNSNAGILPANSVVNTPAKQTYIHYFTEEQIGTDINGILSGGVFEFYTLNLEEIISEKMPVPCKYLVIPNNDYGKPNRKRHSSYKFQMNTRGQNVRFTPKLDGVLEAPTTFNTTEKRVCEYFFTDDTAVSKDIGGILESLSDTPFEFYGVVVPQTVEVLPDRLEFYKIPNNNLGVAAPKRFRTIPLILDTCGGDVVYLPEVDGVSVYGQGHVPDVVFNTTLFGKSDKRTVWLYFSTDVFGTDIGGTLTNNQGIPFEFYGFGDFEKVEVLPVGKRYDQLGPLRFDKIGKIFGFRIRMIYRGFADTLHFKVLGDTDVTFPNYGNTVLYEGDFKVNIGMDDVYQVDFPKSINTTMCRLVLGPASQPFHRYDAYFRVSMSGMETDARWMPIR